MSQTFEPKDKSPKALSDKEIAQDILTSHKYLSNYYYAPAILESMDPKIRGVFQDIHKDTQEEAKMVFDYLHSRGWYNPRPADQQAMNDLMTASQESQKTISSLVSDQTKSQSQGGRQMIGREIEGQESLGWQGWSQPQGGSWQQGAAQPLGSGWQQGAGQFGSMSTGWQNQGGQGWQSQGTGQAWQAGSGQPLGQNWGSRQWTGTQTGEGQSGMGPSSLYQGARWGGQPSWGQGAMRESSWQGVQSGEGQSGMGPSSLHQWTRWGGQPSWSSGFPGGQATASYGRTWQPQTAGQGFSQGWQPGFGQGLGSSWQAQGQGQGWNPQGGMGLGQGWQSSPSSGFGTRQWTGTEQGEGQGGMGPSSLYQGARWGGQPSWASPNWGGQGGF